MSNTLIKVRRSQYGKTYSKLQPWQLKTLYKLPVNSEFVIEQLLENKDLEFQFQYKLNKKSSL